MSAADRPPVCDYEGSDYQTTFWEQGGRAYEDRVEAVALQRLLPASGKLLLELGAGAGRNTPRYHGFERVVLLDYSRTQLVQARERLGSAERYIYVAANVYRLPFVSRLFDAATMIRTLHHLADTRLALSQVHQVMQPGATFILEFANKHNIALADAAARWEHLCKEGLPYLTLLHNTINHPDDRGHRLFAEELWKCFKK